MVTESGEAGRVTAGGHAGGSHTAGVLLVLGSAAAFSLAGVLTKLVASDAWTVVCWRGFFGAPLIVLYVMWRARGRPLGATFRLGWRGWVLATITSLTSAAFIAAFKLTYVANVVIVYATVPFVAAALGWLALRERVRAATMAAAMAALAGVAIMVSGSAGAGHLAGDLLAVLMTVGMAVYMVLIRVLRRTPVVLALAASSLQLFAAGWVLGDPLAVSAGDFALLALFGVAFALGAVLLTEGTRLIPAAEAGLLGTADTPLAVLLAWLALAELPPAASVVGGAIALGAVIAHAGRDVVQASARRQQVSP